jgi:hypothetical protein
MIDGDKYQRLTALVQEAYSLAASTDSSNNPAPFTNCCHRVNSHKGIKETDVEVCTAGWI